MVTSGINLDILSRLLFSWGNFDPASEETGLATILLTFFFVSCITMVLAFLSICADMRRPVGRKRVVVWFWVWGIVGWVGMSVWGCRVGEWGFFSSHVE